MSKGEPILHIIYAVMILFSVFALITGDKEWAIIFLLWAVMARTYIIEEKLKSNETNKH